MKSPIYIAILIFSILTSCEKKDRAVVLPPPGPAAVAEIEMGAGYENQVYFDIDSAKAYSRKNSDWELSFESGKNGWHIRINGGLLIKAANTGNKNWSDHYTKTQQYKSDAPNGHRDSTAIGEWLDTSFFVHKTRGYIYIIDRGDGKPAAERYKKLRILSVDPMKYRIHHANLDGSDEDTSEIFKGPANSYFTFANGGKQIYNFEPPTNKWDIVFTSYAYIYHEYNPPLSYVVRGVLLNGVGVCCARDSVTGFENINRAKALSLTYSKAQDIIGFDWKTYDSGTGKYITRSHVTYIIKSKKGNIYKLRFIDFYNNLGQKGYPKFEYQQL